MSLYSVGYSKGEHQGSAGASAQLLRAGPSTSPET